MKNVIHGKVWKFGDDVNTDVICPGPLMRLPLDRIGQAAMAGIDPNFHKKILKGDIIVAGKNFGSGSSRELAPLAVKKAGIGSVVAESFARIFYRNCIAIGFPILECKMISDYVDEGDELEISFSTGRIRNMTTKEEYRGTQYPAELQDIFLAGGIISWIKRRGVNTLKAPQ